MEATIWHSKPFDPYFFTSKCSLQTVIGLVHNLWFLLHYPWWTITETMLCCSCPQDWLSHAPVYKVNSTMLPSPGGKPVFLNATTGEGWVMSAICCKWQKLRRSIFSLPHGRHNLLSHFPTLGPAYPCAWKQGQLYCTAQMRCKTLFPECFSWRETGPVLPSGVVSEGTGPILYSSFFLAFGDIRSCRHQNTSLLHQGQEPRHGFNPDIRYHNGPGSQLCHPCLHSLHHFSLHR